MDNSDEQFAYQKEMSALIYGQTASIPSQWKCGSIIANDTIAEIYQRNFHGGLQQHMKVQFPVTSRYLGDSGFRFLLTKLVSQQPPQSPLFSVYAASLPGAVLDLEGFGDESLRQCTSMLATIDFFTSNAEPGQSFPMESRYCRLHNEVANHPADNVDMGVGLYQLTHLHPQGIAEEPSETVMLKAE